MENLADELDEDEILISMVQNKALLYDKSSPLFKDNQKKNEAWCDIASQICVLTERPIEVKLITRRWETLKKKYMDERRKLMEYIPSGSATPEITSTWKYFTIMDFLKKHVQHRQTFSNFNLPVRGNLEESCDDDSEGDEDSRSEEQSQTSIEDETCDDPSEESETSLTTRATRVTEVNNYLLVFRDAWNKIPDKNRRRCFFKLREVIRDKKKEIQLNT